MNNANLIRNVASVALIILMTLCASLSGNKEFIFPEIGALCVGLWIVDKKVWRVRLKQIPVIFSLAAIIGVCIVRFVPAPLTAQMELGFLLVALLLMAFDSNIMPAFPACLLPILMGTADWFYPVVVLVATSLLAFGQFVMEKTHLRTPQEAILFSAATIRAQDLSRWLSLMAILAPALLFADSTDFKFVVAPPIIVTLVEFSNATCGFRQRPVFTLLTLFLAACTGVFTEAIMCQMWHLPQYLCAAIAVSVVLLFFHQTQKYFAPAVAVCLIPLIVPADQLLWFPLHIAIGAAYAIYVPKYLFQSE